MQQPEITLLVTRPEPSGTVFARSVLALSGRPVRVVLSPLMVIEPVAVTLDELPSGLILTSVNGVAAAERSGLPKGLTAWCVGDRTAEAAATAGFVPISAKGDSSDLIRAILDRRPAGSLLHLHGAHQAGEVTEALARSGIACRGRVGYRQVSCDLSPEARRVLDAAKPVIVPLFSPRSVSILAQQGPFAAPLAIVAISSAVAQAAQVLRPAHLIEAETPDAAAMRKGVGAAFDSISLATGA